MEGLLGIAIRPYSGSDYTAVCEILASSFASKFTRLSGLKGEALVGLLSESRVITPEPHKGYWVAVLDGKVLGVIELASKSLSKPEGRGKVRLKILVQKLGLLRAIAFLLGYSILSDSSDKGEIYIKQIAVSSVARGRGVGRALLNKAEALARELDCSSLSLYVAASNPRAHALYQRFGFIDQVKTSSMTTKLFFGERSWVRMLKPLQESQKMVWALGPWWPLGLLGMVGFIQIPAIIGVFYGGTSPLILTNLLWFLWFSFLVPRKRPKTT